MPKVTGMMWSWRIWPVRLNHSLTTTHRLIRSAGGAETKGFPESLRYR
jgi:hypothetical protein